MRTAVIDVGGGMRGIYAAGVLDCCLDEHVVFDLGIGISAGSANVASYFAGQRGRNLRYYTDYAFRKEYMSLQNFIQKKSFIDLDYIYGTLSNADGEYPLDYQAIMRNPATFLTLACNALTGETKCFDKTDLSQDNYDIFKASCAIPFICEPYVIDGIPYYDGALGDTVPIDLAEDCEKLVLILTKLKSDQLDCAFVGYQESLCAGLHYFHLADDPLVAIVPVSDSHTDVFPISDFSEQEFLMPSDGFDIDILPLFNHYLGKDHPRIRYTNLSDSAIVSMVEHNLGISLLSELIMQDIHSDVRALPLDPPVFRRLGIAASDRQQNDKIIRRFIRCAQAVIGDMYDESHSSVI